MQVWSAFAHFVCFGEAAFAQRGSLDSRVFRDLEFRAATADTLRVRARAKGWWALMDSNH